MAIQNVLEAYGSKVIGGGGSNSGGHIIQDASGTDLTQRDTIQFKGMTVTDDATNGKTVVEATKTSVGLGNVPNVTTDNQTPTVTEASARTNLATGDTLKTIIGKIKKFFTDIKDLAFIAKDGSTSKYLRGDGTWQTFPTMLTMFTYSGTFDDSTVSKQYTDNRVDNKSVVIGMKVGSYMGGDMLEHISSITYNGSHKFTITRDSAGSFANNDFYIIFMQLS